MKKPTLRRTLAATLAAALLGFSSFKVLDDGDDFELIKNLEIFHTLVKNLRILYVDETSSGDLIKTAMDKMLENLDPYTVYYPESLVEDVMFMNSGDYAGTGIELEMMNGKAVIAQISENSPAHKNGLLIGDILISADGKTLAGKSENEIDLILKGEAGSTVKFQIERQGEKITKDIRREVIKQKSIPYYGVINGNTGYINLSSFTENCSAEFKEALLKLKNEKKITNLIIDLRYNPGGLLIEAVNIVNLFVDKGKDIVEMRGRVQEWNKMFRAENNPVDTQIPIVVLVNGKSASAAEIVSGALQDLDRAVVIGEKTFGKGLVQTTKDLVYNAKCKITTAKYYIPSGRCIQKLDYSHKNKQGKAESIPDSLIRTFKTANGRPVKDAGGIMPDISVSTDTISYLVENLINKNIIFDYATKYRINNATIAEPEKFTVTQAEIDQLKKSAGANLTNYQTITEQEIAILEKTAANDFKSPEIAQKISGLKDIIKQIKSSEINKYDSQIKKALEYEIIRRYYYEQGEIRYTLQNDPYITAANQVLKDAILYKKTLSKK
ncbi:MAG: S41 family peptidase [Bacteroidales bacterium]|nr:S41 family peptidase [Bacteroidales bacterium]